MENKLNARGLRVGNYLMDTMEDAGIIQVLEIKEMSDSQKGNMAISYVGVKGGYCTTSLEEDADHDEERFIQPIPITEGELVKLGFEKVPTMEWLYKKHPLIVNAGNHFVVTFKKTPLPCESVHQLQNLYYSLTGKELTYNN